MTKNNNGFGLVIIAAAATVFWLAIGEGIVWAFGKVLTPWAWAPVCSSAIFFCAILAGLNWFASETR